MEKRAKGPAVISDIESKYDSCAYSQHELFAVVFYFSSAFVYVSRENQVKQKHISYCPYCLLSLRSEYIPFIQNNKLKVKLKVHTFIYDGWD